MNTLTRNTVIMTLATLLCLTGLTATAGAQRAWQDQTPTDEQAVLENPASKHGNKRRGDASGQRERAQSRSRDEDRTSGWSGGRDGQANFEGRQREHARGVRSESDRISRASQSGGPVTTAMNVQEGIAPSEDVLRPDTRTKSSGRSEGGRPNGRRDESGHGVQRRSGPPPSAQEGIAPAGDAPILDLRPQEGDRTRSGGREDGGAQVGSRRSDDGDLRPGTSGNGINRRTDLHASDGRGSRNDERYRHTDDRNLRRGDDTNHNSGWDDRRVRNQRDDDRRGDDRRSNDSRHGGWSRNDNGGDKHFQRGGHDRKRVVKHVIHHIPSRHAVIVHGRDRYHYHAGRYYRPWEGGFILVRPPLGLIVLNIPLGSRMFISAGITYHVFGDVFYRRVPTGYMVVEPVRERTGSWPELVTVSTDLLNVRYGPYEDEEVIAQVERYTVLNVLGAAPGWLYVEVLGEEIRGWVMERYVVAGAARG